MSSPTANICQPLDCDSDPQTISTESLCLNCYKNGTTRLLFTKIAFFKEVVVASFSCPHCGYENRSLDRASQVADKGLKVTVEINKEADLNRRIVWPSGSSIVLPDVDSTFPNSNGSLTTIEGALTSIIENLESLQPEREKIQPDVALKVNEFLQQLRDYLEIKKKFTLILDDPSGNGFIENLLAPDDDPQMKIEFYVRTREQDASLGIVPDEDDANNNISTIEEEDDEEANNQEKEEEEGKETEKNTDSKAIGKDEVLSFRVNCPSCNALCDNNMKLVDIPHFKEIVLMAVNCPACGYKNSEVRSGGGISPLGKRYRLKITNIYDLSRDILVSETASFRFPHLDFESMGGTLGGRFTTIEGFLISVKEQLISANPFIVGDSATSEDKSGKLGKLIADLEKVISGEKTDVILELTDPAGNSYLQNIYAPDPDPELEAEDYERNEEENETLGLNDMKVTDYET